MTGITRLHPVEFIALMAMIMATTAFSIDATLPAVPQIAAELTPFAPNRAQLVVTSFLLGLGLGVLVAGPLSDRFGRKPVLLAGAILYCGATLLAYAAPSLELLLLARVLQGLGASAPRVVTLALVRDLYQGREMARVMSFTMMVFLLVPAVAPLIGQAIIAGFGWRAIFLAFLAFSVVSMAWLAARQPETLPQISRRSLSGAALWAGLREILSHRMVRIATLAQVLGFGCLFATLSQVQPIFDQVFGRAGSFPKWFALVFVFAGLTNLINARLVMWVDLRRLVRNVFVVQAGFSAALAVGFGLGLWPGAAQFPLFMVWLIGLFSMLGLTTGNLMAMAMVPLGHVAGMAASVTGSLATIGSVLIAAPIGLAFDGTPRPLLIGVAVLSALAAVLMRAMPKPG